MHPRVFAGAFGAALLATPAAAEGLPAVLAWSAYDVGSAGYSQAVGIGAALKNRSGVTLRVLPGKNDVSRLAPLRDGKVHFSATGFGSGYLSIEGVFNFGERDWGPQPVRLVAMSNGEDCAGIIVAGDIGVRTYADLKGKRLPWVKGAPALNYVMSSYLRFAGLDLKDVTLVEFGGYGATMDAVVAGQLDGALTNSSSGFATKIAAGPRGHIYPPVPHDDAEGWKRLNEVAPFLVKHICREGAGVTEPFESASYPYPVLIAYDSQDPQLVHAMTKAIFDLYPDFKDAAPGARGWALDRQVLNWVMPFHEGAIRYYREAGRWTAEMQENNDRLLERERLLRTAWEGYKAGAPQDAAAFAKGWMERRHTVLQEAGFNPVWRDW